MYISNIFSTNSKQMRYLNDKTQYQMPVNVEMHISNVFSTNYKKNYIQMPNQHVNCLLIFKLSLSEQGSAQLVRMHKK